MQLTVREAAELLAVSERTIYRWVRRGQLQAHRLNNQVRFNRAELLEWATAEQLEVSSEILGKAGAAPHSLPSLAQALARGGVHFDIAGSDKATAIKAVVDRLTLPAGVDSESLWRILLAREALGSTGIGGGIALPHVRNPIILHGVEPAVALCFLAKPIDFAALDGQPVCVLFLLLSPTVPVHLHLLSRLSFMLRDPAFKQALDARAQVAAILATAERAEAGLVKPMTTVDG